MSWAWNSQWSRPYPKPAQPGRDRRAPSPRRIQSTGKNAWLCLLLLLLSEAGEGVSTTSEGARTIYSLINK